MTLRIAVWHNLPSGGGKRALSDQVRGLVRRGHEVEAWCPSTADRSFLPLSEVVPEHVVPLQRPAAATGRRGWATRPYREAVAEAEAVDHAAALAAEQINRRGFDLLFAGSCLIQFCPAIGRFVDLPSAVYLGEPNRDLYEARAPGEGGPQLLWLDEPPRLEPRHRLLAPLGRPKRALEWALHDYSRLRSLRLRAQAERRNALAFDAILVNSHFSREAVLRSYGLESRVSYLGVDVDAFRQASAPKEPFVVGLGSLYHPAKRPELAIRSVATIEADRRPPLVWIANAAATDYIDLLHELARRLGVELRVLVNIADDQLVDLLGRAAAMVYTPRLEPFGYAPLEANACGTAVVAVAEGGVRETVRDGISGTLLPDPDPEQVGRAIRSYTDDLGRSAEVGRSARRHVEEHWRLDASIDRLEAHLLRVAQSSRRRPRGTPPPPATGGKRRLLDAAAGAPCTPGAPGDLQRTDAARAT